MFNSSWKKLIETQLGEILEDTNRSARVALLGIGNELKGDDAAGVLIARRLIASLPARDDRLVLEAGLAPENFGGPLRRFRPDLVLLVDAGDFGDHPGAVDLIDWREAEGFSGSTHTMPPGMLAGFLQFQLSCTIVILAIQAAQTQMDAPLTPAVAQAVAVVVADLAALLA